MSRLSFIYRHQTIQLSEDEVSDLLQKATTNEFRILYDPLPTVIMPVRTTSTGDAPKESMSLERPAREVAEDSKKKKLVAWVGEESTALTKLLMTSSGSPVSRSKRLSSVAEIPLMSGYLVFSSNSDRSSSESCL